ncbi:hypothetical protein INR49_026717 [Caranx melampygus]|nr:hypothetical protein INR49_026717 [Caranx melampygus]
MCVCHSNRSTAAVDLDLGSSSYTQWSTSKLAFVCGSDHPAGPRPFDFPHGNKKPVIFPRETMELVVCSTEGRLTALWDDDVLLLAGSARLSETSTGYPMTVQKYQRASTISGLHEHGGCGSSPSLAEVLGAA